MELKVVNIVNLTPHDVHILDPEYYAFRDQLPVKIKYTIPMSGVVVRVSQYTTLEERVILDNTVIDISSTEYTDVVNMPPPVKGTIYVVSKQVAERLMYEREDIYILSGLVRKPGGAVIGGRSIAKLKPPKYV